MLYVYAANLCSSGWVDVKCMVVSVVVGFLHMSISMFVFLLVIVRSRKLMWPSDSSVGLNCRLLWIVFMYCVRHGWLLRHHR